MPCDHKRTEIEESTWQDWDGEDHTTYERVERSTLVDIDTGRMKCSMCGAIEYYTGQWREFWETGKPCLGSDKYTK